MLLMFKVNYRCDWYLLLPASLWT